MNTKSLTRIRPVLLPGVVNAAILFCHLAGAQEMHCPGPNVVRVAKPKAARQALVAADFGIHCRFAANVPADYQTVIRYATAEWNSVLLTHGVNPASYEVNVQLGVISAANTLAVTTNFFDEDGVLDHADMVIRMQWPWYVDPIPADDSEFSGTPPMGHDLLSVVRHELGHAVGWTQSKRVTSLVAAGVFDASRLNIAVLDNGGHVDPSAHPDELMQPSIGAGVRRGIQLYPTAALVARAYEYDIPMRFVDPNFDGEVEYGSAARPWREVLRGEELASAGASILLAPTTHRVHANQEFRFPHTWISARGGATVLIRP